MLKSVSRVKHEDLHKHVVLLLRSSKQHTVHTAYTHTVAYSLHIQTDTMTYWKEEGHDKRSLSLKDRTRSGMDVNASAIRTKNFAQHNTRSTINN